MRLTAALLFPLLLAGAPVAGAPATPPARLDATRFVLGNGMTFLLFSRPELASVAAGWVVAAGSARDPEGETGLAHLLEHLMFKGTATLPAPDALDQHYTAAGATGVNAFTTQDTTAYVVSVPADKLELWFWLESDRLLAPTFGGLETERQVVREEQRQTQGAGAAAFDEQIDAAFWTALPYRRSRWGGPGEVERVGAAEVRAFFDRNYAPANLTAVLIGRFDPRAVRGLAERYFGRLPARPAAIAPAVPAEPPQPEERHLLASCRCTPQLVARYHTAPFLDADVPALEVLAGLLNGRGGFLEVALVAPGLAGRASAEQQTQALAGYFAFKAEAPASAEGDGKAALAAIDRVLGQLTSALASTPVPAELVARVKNGLVADGYRRLTNPYFLGGRILVNAGMGDWSWINRQGELLQAVEPADLQRVAATYFKPQNRVLAELTREEPAP